MDRTLAAAAAFHAQPIEKKMELKVDNAMQGYLPMRGSTTRTSTLNANNKPNENEAFFVKREGEAGVTNRWPDVPGFKETTLAYYEALEALAIRMLPLYARALDLPAEYFDAKCERPFSSLRLSHYPPVPAYAENQFGIAPHTDSTFITLLAQNKVAGLQIRRQDGVWIDAPVIDGTFIVNTGDILHRWTNGRFLSTPHRAFNVSGGSRYAIPYFFHPSQETLIECLRTCRVEGEEPRFPAMTTAEYMAWFRGRNYDHLRKSAPAAAAE
ncbi:isopenicillin N synthase family oxygenase [Roseomonas eburnea]|uniref:2-oxoglutarate-dependent ethylene/succinate-forming enzyme n=2 Tax=Neoroseomonas eburnea TaxID=1346889 RepID=A0A9X9XGG7_9PROT|nr:isopenicillin N synthase family oxygenase [Neoroseomonas eburnea]